MRLVDAFFREIDERWTLASTTKIRLKVIGSAALMLQSTYQRGTKDSDIIATLELTEDLQRELLAIGGRASELSRRRRMYLDIVPNGIPFLPQEPRWRPIHGLTGQLEHFEVEALDVIDVVVSKLKRFSAADRDDIDEMLARHLVPHDALVRRFCDALEGVSGDSFSERLARFVENLNEVERDLYGVPESTIELPSCR